MIDRRFGGVIVFVLALLFSGCGTDSFYEYTDYVYLQKNSDKSVEELDHMLNSGLSKNRRIALRTLALKAASSNDIAVKKNIAEIMMSHFDGEKNPAVKSVLVAICLRDVGFTGDNVFDFLANCISEADSSEDAIQTMAVLFPERSVPILSDLLSHNSIDIRLNSALALRSIDNSSAVSALRKSLENSSKKVYDKTLLNVYKRVD